MIWVRVIITGGGQGNGKGWFPQNASQNAPWQQQYHQNAFQNSQAYSGNDSWDAPAVGNNGSGWHQMKGKGMNSNGSNGWYNNEEYHDAPFGGDGSASY